MTREEQDRARTLRGLSNEARELAKKLPGKLVDFSLLHSLLPTIMLLIVSSAY